MPRALLPVGHRPLVSYALSWLHDTGVRTVAICGNRDTRALLSAHERVSPAGTVATYHEDAVPRGAAGSIRDAAFATDHTTFIVAEGAAIPNVRLVELLASHHASGAAATVVVYNDARRQGDPAEQVPTGIYVFDRRALELVPATGFFDIKEDLIGRLYRAGERVVAFTTSEPSARVMSPSTYLAVNGWIVEKMVAADQPPYGYTKTGECLLHRDATIDRTATFVGPVLVAAGAHIHAGATIVGPCSVGCDAIVHEGVVVSRSAIWRRSTVGPRAVADRSIVIDDAVVDPGERAYAQIVNRRHARDGTLAAAQAGAAVSPRARRPITWPRSPADIMRTVGRMLTPSTVSR